MLPVEAEYQDESSAFSLDDSVIFHLNAKVEDPTFESSLELTLLVSDPPRHGEADVHAQTVDE
jgi:hypothetical protein